MLLNINRFFSKRKAEVPKPQVVPVVIGGNEPEIVEREPYRWISQDYETEARSLLEAMRSAKHLGLRNQAVLNAREVVALSFRDFTEGNGLDVHEFRLGPLTHNHDTGLHRIEGALDLWMMHELDSRVVRLPQGALNALQTLETFPCSFIQNVKVLQKVEKQVSSKDYRFTGEKSFHFPTTLPAYDPLLVIKIGGRWFSVFQWE